MLLASPHHAKQLVRRMNGHTIAAGTVGFLEVLVLDRAAFSLTELLQSRQAKSGATNGSENGASPKRQFPIDPAGSAATVPGAQSLAALQSG